MVKQLPNITLPSHESFNTIFNGCLHTYLLSTWCSMFVLLCCGLEGCSSLSSSALTIIVMCQTHREWRYLKIGLYDEYRTSSAFSPPTQSTINSIYILWGEEASDGREDRQRSFK